MGMPGSETALEQLMSTILGDLVKEGVVAKVADDLYCGGDTPELGELGAEYYMHFTAQIYHCRPQRQ